MSDDKKGGINPAATALGGLIIGAAAGAAAVALSDKDNRKKLQKNLKQIQDKGEELRIQGTKKFEELKGKLENSGEETKEELEEVKEDLVKK